MTSRLSWPRYRVLKDKREAIKAELKKHRRAISHEGQHPDRCMCGWKGGKKGSGFYDHLTDVVLATLLPDAPECDQPTPHTIDLHRAVGEPLCKGCEGLIAALV